MAGIFHPHIHALVTEGVFAPDGELHAAGWPPPGVLEEALRGLLLAALRRAERLSEEFSASLLAWRHSGFSVHGEQRLEEQDGAGLELLARCVTRPALAAGAVTLREDGRVELATPPDPRTGAIAQVLDPLDFVHAAVTQIPDARKHLVRYYGATSHRCRSALRRLPPSPAPRRRIGAPPGRGCWRRSSRWNRCGVPAARGRGRWWPASPTPR